MKTDRAIEMAGQVLRNVAGYRKDLSTKPNGTQDLSVWLDDGAPRIEVRTYAALVQVLGYLRYQLNNRCLLYRGQDRCHLAMRPGAYRPGDGRALGEEGVTDSRLTELLEAFWGAHSTWEGSNPIYRETTEPALQHYGVATRWLDVVDSIPHALFFAVRRLVAVQNHRKFGDEEPGLYSYQWSDQEYGVVYVLDLGSEAERVQCELDGRPVPGCWAFADGTSLVDLRRAKPSEALRPHAQHGYLFRGQLGARDYSEHVVARIFVPVKLARHWLGEGIALAVEDLIPRTEHDTYFRVLCEEPMTRVLREERERTGVGFGEIMRFVHHL